jgi:hypothetical protein
MMHQKRSALMQEVLPTALVDRIRSNLFGDALFSRSRTVHRYTEVKTNCTAPTFSTTLGPSALKN